MLSLVRLHYIVFFISVLRALGDSVLQRNLTVTTNDYTK
jgi:hypothetical protein